MTNANDNSNESDDSAPESISFDTGKLKTTEQSLRVKEQVTTHTSLIPLFNLLKSKTSSIYILSKINMIRESQKKKRIQRQEMYIEQKVIAILESLHFSKSTIVETLFCHSEKEI